MTQTAPVRRTWVELALFVAISNMVGLPRAYEFFGLDPATIPWWLLIVGLLVPVAGYVGAILVSRRRNLLERALVLLAGLAVVSAIGLTIVAIQGALL